MAEKKKQCGDLADKKRAVIFALVARRNPRAIGLLPTVCREQTPKKNKPTEKIEKGYLGAGSTTLLVTARALCGLVEEAAPGSNIATHGATDGRCELQDGKRLGKTAD